jgi:hypothetical protein
MYSISLALTYIIQLILLVMLGIPPKQGKIKVKKLFLYATCVLMTSHTAMANHKVIPLENNTYQMENICFNAKIEKTKYESFYRYYKFTFNSKYSAFENYSSLNMYSNMVSIETDLHTIKLHSPTKPDDTGHSVHSFLGYIENSPELIANKKTIEILLNEEDMKKLYESNLATVVFKHLLFAPDYTKADPYYGTRPIPAIHMPLNKKNFNNELAKCNTKYNRYTKEYKKYHSNPINRVKSFFDL